MNKNKIACVVVFLGIVFPSCSNKNEYLATFDGGGVSSADFLNDYQNYLRATGLTDNMASRKLILDNVIHEKLVLAEFSKSDLSKSVPFIEAQNNIFEQLLLNHLFEHDVMQDVRFSDRQLATYYTEENTLYHIKQLFAETYDTALNYYESLNSGMSFSELVNREKIPDANYDLGFVSLNAVHPHFRKTVQKLHPGDLSLPIKGKFGYTVLKIEEKRVKPLLTEYEFAKQKKILSGKIAIEYRDSLRNDYIWKLARNLEIDWFARNIPDFLEMLKESGSKAKLPIHDDGEDQFREPICRVDGVDYNYYTLLPLLLKSRQTHLDAVYDNESIQDLIAGVIIREKLLARAREQKLDTDPEFQEQYHRKISKLKMDTWVENFTDAVHFSEAEYCSYYRSDSTEFMIPVRRDVFEICVPDLRTAEVCVARFQKGEQFSDIAREFSQYHQEKAADGSLGILKSGELGKFGAAVFSAPLGVIVGPLQYDDAYYLFLSTAEFPARQLSLEEAKPIIVKKYHREFSRRRLNDYLKEKEEDYNVRKDIQKLTSIQYQDIGISRESL